MNSRPLEGEGALAFGPDQKVLPGQLRRGDVVLVPATVWLASDEAVMCEIEGRNAGVVSVVFRPDQVSLPASYVWWPRSAGEAEAMEKVGHAYLREFAPERLTAEGLARPLAAFPPPDTSGPADGEGYGSPRHTLSELDEPNPSPQRGQE